MKTPPVEDPIAIVEPALENVAADHDKRFRVGTLQYTKMGLVMLFIWLLWGDFCFTLMEQVLNILPLKLQSLKASDTLIMALTTTIPLILNIVITPIVSYRSDRHRGRHGRRIPYLLWPSIPLALLLILLGQSETLGHRLQNILIGSPVHLSPMATVLMLMGGFLVLFQVFHMIVASVYYYLFNDVVPEAFLSRFMSLFRIMGTAAGSSFNFFLFPHALTHMKEIFFGVGVLYLVAFLAMSLKVREGKYPPPPPNVDQRTGFKAAARTYFTECFTHRFYWYLFIANSMGALGACFGIYGLLLWQSVGLSLGQIGQVNGYAGVLGLILTYPAGILSDRLHPVRAVVISGAIGLLFAPMSYVWLFIHPSPQAAYWIYAVPTFLAIPAASLGNAAMFPMMMRLMPKERYGQFCAADAVVRCVVTIPGSLLVGLLMDGIARKYHGDAFHYRYAAAFATALGVFGFILRCKVFSYWKSHGGDEGYVPPGTVHVAPTQELEVVA